MYDIQENDDFDMGSESSCSSLHEIPMEMDLTAAGPPISDDETEMETQGDNRCMKLARRVGPHFGLVTLLGCYLVMGAIIFKWIEGDNERIKRDEELTRIFMLRDGFQDHIWNITQNFSENKISREAFNTINQEYFEKLVAYIFESYRNQYINEKHLLNKTRGDALLWTFHNSVFFATTVITTIGYGNLVPTTTKGRIICIVFALFGIPLLLVTITDLGKFLSEFLSFLYRHYRRLKRKLVRRRTRKVSYRYRSNSQSAQSDAGESKAGSMNLHDMDTESESSTDDELRIPLFMVALVLLAYTAVGGILFTKIDNLTYFEAFYFCFITMATVGFGDIVPTDHREWQTYITMIYIICGLSLATMCIDLAGTEYIRKFHYLGSKMEDAKGTLITGLQVGEHIIKHTGYEVIKTAGGKLVRVSGAMLNSKEAQEMGIECILTEFQHKNILYEPLSANVAKLVKENNIKVMPDDITERDGYIVQNKSYNRQPQSVRGYVRVSANTIHRDFVTSNGRHAIITILSEKESNI